MAVVRIACTWLAGGLAGGLAGELVNIVAATALLSHDHVALSQSL